MGKSKWKIFQVMDDLFIAVIPPSNSKWKIEWHMDYEGNYTSKYYDDDIKENIWIPAFQKFSTGSEAAQYINNIEKRKSFFVKDVSEEYFIK